MTSGQNQAKTTWQAVKINSKLRIHQLNVFERGGQAVTAPSDCCGQAAELALASIPRPPPEKVARGGHVRPRRLDCGNPAGKLLEELGPHRRGVGGAGLQQSEEPEVGPNLDTTVPKVRQSARNIDQRDVEASEENRATMMLKSLYPEHPSAGALSLAGPAPSRIQVGVRGAQCACSGARFCAAFQSPPSAPPTAGLGMWGGGRTQQHSSKGRAPD